MHVTFLRSAAAVLAGSLVLAACGGRPAPPPSPPTTFIDLVPALPSNLDPVQPGGPGFAALETSLAGTLVRPVGVGAGAATLAAPQRVNAYLARSWTELPSGDYVFRLRHGVTSPYGHTLSAGDVRFSFARALARSAAARALARLAGIDVADPITALGPDTVRLNVAARSALTLAVVAGFRFGILDASAVRAHPGGWLERHVAFYGAYRVASFSPGVQLLLFANPRWPAPLAFAHVAVEADRSAAVRLADVGTRAASHTTDLDWGTFAAATRTAGIDAALWPSTDLAALVPNTRVAPLDDARVRRVLSLALDDSAIIRAAFSGLARPAGGAVIPVRQDDPVLARRLLARAGHRHGFALTLAGSTAGGSQTGAELAAIARQLRAVGIAVRTRIVSSDAALAALMRGRTVGGVLVRSSAAIASVPYEIAACCLAGSPGNLGAYREPALAALVASALRGGPARALAAVRSARAILAASVPQIPIAEIPSQNVTLTGITGYAGYAVPATYYDLLRR